LDLPSLEGNRVTLTSLRGKWVLLDFWGTWCLPCVEEMPKIQGLYDELRRTRPGKAAVLTIACHDEPRAVTAFMNTNGYLFPVVLGDEATIEKWEVRQYPFKLLVTPAGRLMTLPSDPSWEEVARRYLFSPAGDVGNRLGPVIRERFPSLRPPD
ncbi:MAG TPA: TlpA disulfide reductase family protein, partial [Vicinamibacteria bacterium]|nr:TlpA disulfide reductase family protein [Vicinamibacteria bacterium]